MTTPRDTENEADAILREAGALPDEAIDLGLVALALGACDRPRVGLQRYRDHLATLARDAATELARRGGEACRIEECVAALNAVLVDAYGYGGDSLTYDDLQNANLLRVIDRRKGLPVALGILYIATARSLGWDMVGLNFPGHFLIRLEHGGERAILDPFHGGRIRTVPELRDMLKAAAGEGAELDPVHYMPASSRSVLLRLQNNIKLRLMQMGDVARALAVVERMLLLAPDLPELRREAGLLNAHLGNLQAAITAFERYLAVETDDRARHRTAALLQDLRSKLH